MTAATATDIASQLRQFVATPAYGALTLHVQNDVWKPPLVKRVAGGIANEIADIALGNELGDDGPAPRHLIVSWTANHAEVARFETGRGQVGSDLMRVILVEARRLRVPIGFSWRTENFGVEVTHTGGLYHPRPLPGIGKLGSEVRLLDTADRFDAAITRIDRPGIVRRKVLRKDDLPVTFRVTMDREQTCIDYPTRKNPTKIEFANADLLGIVHASRMPTAFTTTDAYALPTLSGWHRADYRGRDLATWIYERVMQRLGI